MTPTLPGASFFGRTLRTQEIAGVTLTETTYPARAQVPRHCHERPYFCLVLDGGFTEEYEGLRRVCDPSTLVFHPSGERHADRFGGLGGRCFNIELGTTWLGRIPDRRWLEDPEQYAGGQLPSLALGLREESARRDDASALVVEGLVLQMLGSARRHPARRHGAPPPWLLRARELVSARFAEPLRVRHIAAAVGVHPVHLARCFRASFGCSVGEYVRQLRIAWACRALRESKVPIAQVALEAGFYDQSHLSRTLQRALGVTPGKLRDAARRR